MSLTSALISTRTLCSLGAALALSAGLLSAANAGPEDGRRGPEHGSERGHAVHGAPAGGFVGGHNGGHNVGPNRWYDGAYGHGHVYPNVGWSVRALPYRSNVVFWGGINYGFFDGVWYAPGSGGYMVVRPPVGIVVDVLPGFRTVVNIGGFPYYYANGVYYRERTAGGYEVVPTPLMASGQAPAGSDGTPAPVARVFIYPSQGQSPEKQASDEYDCHRWAATQSGFDPTAAATSTPGTDTSRRGDYRRAQTACLEGRGYTLK